MNRTLTSVYARKKSVKTQLTGPRSLLTRQKKGVILILALVIMLHEGVRAVNMVEMAYSSDTRVTNFEKIYSNELTNAKSSGDRKHRDLNFQKHQLLTQDSQTDPNKEQAADQNMLSQFLNLATTSLSQAGTCILTTLDTLKRYISQTALADLDPRRLSPYRANCDSALCFAQQAASTHQGLSQGGAILLLVFSFITIMGCCASSVICTRIARDKTLAENARRIRRRYQRNKELMSMIDIINGREKDMIPSKMKPLQPEESGNQSSSSSEIQYYADQSSECAQSDPSIELDGTYELDQSTL